MSRYVAIRTVTDGTLRIEEFKAPSDQKARKLARKMRADAVISEGRSVTVRGAASRKREQASPA
jgi:hypothetical protein